MKQVGEVYVSDACNSLSIESYKVSSELIDRVRSRHRNPVGDTSDHDHRNAMAARGYWLSFQSVRQSIEKVLQEERTGIVARIDHANWYRELFSPCVTAGILRPGDLAGYRNGAVYILHSRHTPPSHEAVRDLMPAFFELLQQEEEAAVRAVVSKYGARAVAPEAIHAQDADIFAPWPWA